MAPTLTKIILTLCIAVPVLSQGNNYLDIEQPNFFQYNSPLQHPESLRSRPYFDFLSTLYRHDTTKTDLFRPYARQRRDVAETSHAVAPVRDPLAAAAAESFSHPEKRPRRAILFRPLFVYKQQQVKKQEAAKRRRRV